MITRRKLLALLGAGALPAPILSYAQQSGKRPARVGYLTNDSIGVDRPRRAAFLQGLRELGYIEGQDIVVEYRISNGDVSRLPAMMAELLRLKVDVIFAFTTQAIQAAKGATREVPVVFAALNPVEVGLVASLARPGGNLTGLSLTAGPEINGKYIELLKEIVPKLGRVAALSNPLNPASEVQLKETRSAATALGVTLLVFEARSADDLDPAFAAIKKGRAQALIVLGDSVLLSERRRIAELGIKGRLPSISGIPEHVEVGGLMGYAANRMEIFRRAAGYVDRILKGAKPASLPIEQPTKFDLLVNLRTARALDITMPQSILLRADRVIE